MPSTYSANLRLENLANGEQTGTWGDSTDNNICVLLEQAITGVVSVAVPDANVTLSALNATSDEARNMVIELTGALTASRNIICPTADKLYIVYNGTSGGQTIVFKTSGGTGITIPNGRKRMVYCDSTNVVDALTDLPTGAQVAGVSIVTETGTQTLTNKTITSPTITVLDNALTVQDNADPTKQFQFQASGITTATTRTMTIPDANTTLVGTDATQTLTNKTITAPTLTVRDNAFTIQDQADNTKQAVFEASGITTATTRTFTLPDANTTLVGTDATQTLTNKTFDGTTTFDTKDTLFRLQDDGDATKKVAFQLSGITTGNTRTVTIPDASGTILYGTIATQAEEEANSSITAVTTPGRQHFHPGHLKAWALFDGTLTGTNAPTTGYNVTSITRNSAGNYTVSINLTFSSTNYGFFAMAKSTSTIGPACFQDSTDTKTTSQLQFHCRRMASEATLIDSPEIFVGFWGDI